MEHLSPYRRLRVLTVGLTAAVSVYFMFVLLAEPLRVFAVSATSNVVVNLTVAASISNNCTSPVSLGTITGTGDSGVYAAGRATACTVVTNDTQGYTLAWQVTTGSGGTATGYMISQYNDKLAPYSPAVAGTPETWSVGASTARWGARLSSTSTTVSTGTWGTDAVSEKWLNVGTGSTIIATRNTHTGSGGDIENVGFRAQIGATAFQPTGNYTTTVVFTATGL